MMVLLVKISLKMLSESPDIPLKLDQPLNITVGDCYLPRAEFQTHQHPAPGDRGTVANPRNAAAGTLRQLSAKVVADVVWPPSFIKKLVPLSA